MESVLPLITGSAGALVVLALVSWMFFTGKLHSDAEFQKAIGENNELKAALEAERRAVDETARTGTVTNQLIEALVRVSVQKEEDRRRGGRGRSGVPSAEDLGL